MTEDDVSVEQELQRWSVRGANIIWLLFVVVTILMFLSVDIESTDPSQFDLLISIIISIYLIFGIIDLIRTKMAFRAVGTVLIGAYGSNLLVSSTGVEPLIGSCFFAIFLVLSVSLKK